MALVAGTANAVITFDEFPVGTVISDQYAAQGVKFLAGYGGNLPVIAEDDSMPTSPVLSPQPIYSGDFWMTFTVPTTDVQFLSGYWDTIGSGIIKVYDPSLTFLASLSNTTIGVEQINITGLGQIGYVYFNSTQDPAGADIDNLVVPEPATLCLLGLGALSLLRRKRGV
jgi:hypothetical protein